MPDDEGGEDERDLESLLLLGAEITGSAAGGVAGFLVGGPIGAAGGGAIAPVLVHALRGGAEFFRRHLTHREKARVGAVIELAAERIRTETNAGRQVREDDFFQTDPSRATERSASTEIVEGVLQAAQREYEERKLPYLANLLAEIALRSDVDRAAANLYIRSANSVSYRQLQLVALVLRRDRFTFPPGSYRERELPSSDPVVPILTEIFDLLNRQFLQQPGKYVLGLLDIAPSELRLVGTGAWMAELMQLGRIPPDELIPLYQMLLVSRGGQTVSAPSRS